VNWVVSLGVVERRDPMNIQKAEPLFFFKLLCVGGIRVRSFCVLRMTFTEKRKRASSAEVSMHMKF
jgi:hypothetical protein